jgi:Domain of unknown function (DUF1883)/TIR domain
MKYQYYDLGHLSGGEIVVVNLSGNAANVCLMDSSNFSSYKAGRKFRFYGGNARRSPVRLAVPHSGHWYVTIDFGGHAGSVRASVNVLPGALKPIQEAPLTSMPSLLHGAPGLDRDESGEDEREFDVFVSHASEDKDEVVRPLANALKAGGLTVWYDEFELRIGDSLRQKIDRGLAKSRFGIVVLSQSFFEKGWTNYELDGIVTRAVTGEQILLPIWHNVSKQEVMNYSPSLADKLARNTTTHTTDEIAAEIIAMIKSE